jgi:DNA polymerase-3 subunit beta
MIATVSTALLADALARVIRAVPQKSTLFVLEHVRLTAESDRLEFMATDTELTIRCSIPASVTTSDAVLVQARKLHSVIKALPGDEYCELNLADNMLRVITATGYYVLPVLDARELPEPQQDAPAASVTLPAEYARMIAKCVAYAVSDNECLPHLTGVKIEIVQGELIAVATDSYRLATVTVPINASVDNVHALLPAQAVKLLGKVDGDVTLSIGDTHATISTAAEQIITRLLVGYSYPDWRRVLPSNNTKLVLVERDALVKALRRVAPFVPDPSKPVRFMARDNILMLSVTDPDTGAQAQEHLACTYNGELIEIGFNHKYITEALQHLTYEHVSLAFSTPDRAALITPAVQQELHITALVMPMRL